MGMYVSDVNISIGFEMFTDICKKTCICVKQGNESYVLGTFKNKDDADFFIEKLAEIRNITKEEIIAITNENARRLFLRIS